MRKDKLCAANWLVPNVEERDFRSFPDFYRYDLHGSVCRRNAHIFGGWMSRVSE